MNKLSAGLLPKLFITAFIFGFAAIVTPVAAKSFTYDKYQVDIDVATDGTFTVTEQLNYKFNGEFSAVTRGVLLDDPSVRRQCQLTTGLTCGGFEYISVLEVRDNNNVPLPKSAYKAGNLTDDDVDYFVIDWEFGKRNFDGTTVFPFTVKYKVYGGIRFVNEFAYFYWNTIPKDRGGRITDLVININFPVSTIVNENLKLYSDIIRSVSSQGGQVRIRATDVPASGDLTVSYKVQPGSIAGLAGIAVTSNPLSSRITIDGIDFGQTFLNLDYFPSGKHTITATFPGYEPATKEVDFAANSKNNIDFVLTPYPLTQLFILLNYIALILGCVATPLGLIGAYLWWRRRGRDEDKIETIIPLFKPPHGLRPYLTGSVIDEKVEPQDISGTIIDLAYRGYLTVTELKRDSEYQLDLTDKKRTDLNATEQALLTALFGSDTSFKTSDADYARLVRIKKQISAIYQEMVDVGYFTASPEKVRNNYLGCGLTLFFLGIGLTFCATISVGILLGQIGPFSLGFPVILLGIGLTIAAKYMPRKTAVGSKAANQAAGFKMYLETAEKYRMEAQITPELFEKYLGYAVAFGVQEQWAENFKDIYKGQPDWYHGSSDYLDIYIISRSMRSLNNSLSSNVFYFSSSNGSFGGGWTTSGSGGSFGGFSGGGGGGGFSGAR